MSTRSEDVEAAFAVWVEAREPELQRTAHLLTGDVAAARVHVESALASRLVSAPADDVTDPDPLALRALVTEVLAGRPTALQGDHPVTANPSDPRIALVWDFLGTLSPDRRAALVLRLYRGLDDAEVSGLVGGTADSVADRVTAALDDLAGLLRMPTDQAETVVRSALEASAESTPIMPTSVESVRGVARRRRTRRTRGGLVMAAAALVVVGVPVAGLSGGGLPSPPPVGPSPSDGPADDPDYGPEDRVPPPWVQPRGRDEQILETVCASPSDEEFRSITTIRAGCRTFVVEPE